MRLAMVCTSRVSWSGPNQMPSGAVFSSSYPNLTH